MALNLKVEWQAPVALVDGKANHLIYDCDRSLLPSKAGVYVFAREFGDTVVPIYIGETTNFAQRMEHHFKSVPLMMAVQSQPQVKRILLIGVLKSKPGQQLDKCLQILETTLIRHALAEGHTLVNKQGVKTPVHEIAFAGTKKSHRPFPRHMSVLAR